MKMRRPHLIPLAPQTSALLEELGTLTGRYELLFPGVRSPSRPISENTLNAALRRLGYAKDDMTRHGFRAAASSLLNECGKWNADANEAQLAHPKVNSVRKAYARAEYGAERVEMMHISRLNCRPTGHCECFAAVITDGSRNAQFQADVTAHPGRFQRLDIS